MSHRSVVLIDNFLPEDVFTSISAKVENSSQYMNGKWSDERDSLWEEVTSLVFAKLQEIGLYQNHFPEIIEAHNHSYNQFRPANYGHGNFNGPHIDNGSYVYYIHPHWDENWEGKIKLIEAEEEQYRTGIFAKPNRFIWMNPDVIHDISTTSSDAQHSRVTNLGFLNACFDNNPVGVEYINIFTTD